VSPSNRARCAVLAVLVSLAARSQPAPPGVTEPAPPAATQPAPSAATQSGTTAATEPVPPFLRIGAETGGGIVGGLLIGGTAAWVVYGTLNTQGDDPSRRSAAQVAGAVGVSVGAPIGVSLTGKLLGRQGSFIISWLSSVAGLGVGYGIYGLIRTGSDSSAAKATYALTLLLPIAGAVIGYELTSSDQPSPPSATNVPGVVPSIAVGPGGASFALAGRF